MNIKIIFITIIIYSNALGQGAVRYDPLCEHVDYSGICKSKADSIFQIIKNSEAFDWTDGNNNCEDRANAISLILDKWGIPNGKAWTFAGETFDKKKFEGNLDGYTYHVASAIIVENEGHQFDTLIIDPLMNKSRLTTIAEWSNLLSIKAYNVYLITSNQHYQQTAVSPSLQWKSRDEYYEDTIEGLTRYNNYSWWTRLKTKHFKKARLQYVRQALEKLLDGRPPRACQ